MTREMAISFVKSLSMKGSSPMREGYLSKVSEPDTMSEEDTEDARPESSSNQHINDSDVIACIEPVDVMFKPQYGGPFSALNPSMWPQEILAALAQPEDAQPFHQFDEYGFIIDDDDNNSGKDKYEEDKLRERKNHEDELRLKWISYLEFTYNEVALPRMKWTQVEIQLKHTRVLDEFIKLGIPNTMRSKIWMRISKGMSLKASSIHTYRQFCDYSSHVPSLSDEQVVTVLPVNVCFMNKNSIGIERLKRIIRVIKWMQKSGASAFHLAQESVNLSIIIANLLLICDEEESFWITLAILNEYKSLDHQQVLQTLISTQCGQLDEQLKIHDIELSLITSHWFSSFFAGFIQNSNVLFHFWDQYFYNGSIVLFQITIGLLLGCLDEITDCLDSAVVFNILSDLPSKIQDVDSMMSALQEGAQKVEHLAGFTKKEKLKKSLSLLSMPSTNDLSNETSDLKTKNVRQTSILVELNESIVSIAKHFEAYDPKLRANINPDYLNVDFDDEDDIRYRLKQRRAKALVDFQRHDPDELGFKKNDILSVISERDEHCWIGELNGQRGWFPAKFVELLNESKHEYCIAGDDRVTPFVNDLVRGRLYAAFKAVLTYGMKKTVFIHTHPWTILETIANSCIQTDFNSVYSRLVLTRTYHLDEFARVLTPMETLYRSIAHINHTHENEVMDVKMRSLLCLALNQHILHQWFDVICSSQPSIIEKFYHNWAFLNSPAWKMIKAELKLLTQFSFNLNTNAELPESLQPKSPVSKDGVRDMLIKHHLFSWDI